MFNIGGGEILALLVIGMILIGPDRLPNMAADAARLLIKSTVVIESLDRFLALVLPLDQTYQ